MPDFETQSVVRAAAQAAETSRLLGAGFVPLRASAPAAPPSSTAQVEAKPVPKAATKAASKKKRSRAKVEAEMAELRARYERDAPHEKFVTDHTNIVWGDGDVMARLMFVGEAPGAEEDKQGVPFVGRSGQLLNKMIEAIGLSRPEVYIANVLKTRPPNNATPTVEEAELCAPYLLEQIAIIDPAVIVTLGKPAAQLLLQSSEAMGKLRGSWHEVEIPVGVAGDQEGPGHADLPPGLRAAELHARDARQGVGRPEARGRTLRLIGVSPGSGSALRPREAGRCA